MFLLETGYSITFDVITKFTSVQYQLKLVCYFKNRFQIIYVNSHIMTNDDCSEMEQRLIMKMCNKKGINESDFNVYFLSLYDMMSQQRGKNTASYHSIYASNYFGLIYKIPFLMALP